MGGSGAQEKKPGRVLRPIYQNPQQCEQVGSSLNFVDDHQSGKFLQRPHGSGQTADVNRVFKVEIGARLALCDHPSERGLPALARAKKGRYRMDPEDSGNAVECMRTWNHNDILSLKIVMSSEDFQGFFMD